MKHNDIWYKLTLFDSNKSNRRIVFSKSKETILSCAGRNIRENEKEKQKYDAYREEITVVILFFFGQKDRKSVNVKVSSIFSYEYHGHYWTIRLSSTLCVFKTHQNSRFVDRARHDKWINEGRWVHFDLVSRGAVLSQVNHVYPVISRQSEFPDV